MKNELITWLVISVIIIGIVMVAMISGQVI
jgi:nitrate reductase NapE component